MAAHSPTGTPARVQAPPCLLTDILPDMELLSIALEGLAGRDGTANLAALAAQATQIFQKLEALQDALADAGGSDDH